MSRTSGGPIDPVICGAVSPSALGSAIRDRTRATRCCSPTELRPQLHVRAHERADDAVQGCTGIALRRASLFGRAPVIHDLRIVFTIWGWLDPDPPTDLLSLRRESFDGVAEVLHNYERLRELADSVPEETLRSTPAQVAAAYPAEWRRLLGR